MKVTYTNDTEEDHMAIPRKNRKANENLRAAAGKAPVPAEARPKAAAKGEEESPALPTTIEEIQAIEDGLEAEEVASELADAASVAAEEYKTLGALAGAALLRARMLEDGPEEEEA